MMEIIRHRLATAYLPCLWVPSGLDEQIFDGSSQKQLDFRLPSDLMKLEFETGLVRLSNSVRRKKLLISRE